MLRVLLQYPLINLCGAIRFVQLLVQQLTDLDQECKLHRHAAGISGLVALVYGLIQGPEYGWSDGVVIGAFVAAVVFLVGWVRIELAQSDPLLDPRLFRFRRFAVGSFGVTSGFLVMFGMFFILTQYLQFVLGYSPLEAGVRTLPFAVTMVLVAPNGPRLSRRIGRGPTIATGMTVGSVGLVWLGLLDAGTLTREQVLQEFVNSPEFQGRVQEVVDAGCVT